jgi:ribonucleotide monophosphatase NagD (HAD superfamily)
MPIDLGIYDVIILDGFGTLYDKKLMPLPGALGIIRSIGTKSILFSNVGSMTGFQLKGRLKSAFIKLPSNIITSMDMLQRYLKQQNIKSVFHYGGEAAAEVLTDSEITIVPDDEDAAVLVFTSLPGQDWIRASQSALRLIKSRKVKHVILANPDRLLPSEHVGINVGMMFDMLIKSWPDEDYPLTIVEIGKPMLNRSDFDIDNEARILVIGDNQITDGGLAKSLGADFILISKIKVVDSGQLKVYESLEGMTGNE